MAKLSSTIIQIRTYIDQIAEISQQRTLEEVPLSYVYKLAMERLLSNISEATTRIPEAEKAKAPNVDWRAIANLGNILRHDYENVNENIIRDIQDGDDLVALRAALDLLNRDAEQVRRRHR